jgi:hypothetical protein
MAIFHQRSTLIVGLQSGLILAPAVSLEVIPCEAERHQYDYREIFCWMCFMPNALINCPPATNGRNNAERDQREENFSVPIDHVRVHERDEISPRRLRQESLESSNRATQAS